MKFCIEEVLGRLINLAKFYFGKRILTKKPYSAKVARYLLYYYMKTCLPLTSVDLSEHRVSGAVSSGGMHERDRTYDHVLWSLRNLILLWLLYLSLVNDVTITIY